MNDLSQLLLLTLAVFGGMTLLLWVLTALDPQTSRTTSPAEGGAGSLADAASTGSAPAVATSG